jgi:pimeloyl-ACP methyl ester carboxylesterase
VTDHYLLALHGIGEQTPHFADFALRTLGRTLAARGETLHARPVCYAPLLDRTSKAFERSVEAHGSRGNITQRLSINTLSDALSYRADREVGQRIFQMLDQEVAQLRGDPVTLVCHSLGCLVALDYLNARPALKVHRLITTGCNVGLFTLGQRVMVPWQVARRGSFFNLYYDADALGFPVAGVTPGLEHVIDVKVPRKVWSWSLFVGGLAHNDYWQHGRLWSSTVPGCL